jgi:hypothetical protein
MFPKEKSSNNLILLAFAGLYVVLVVVCFPLDDIQRHPDSAHHFSIARQYALTDPHMFSHGFYPGGYPAYLRLSLQRLDLHPLLAGKLLSAMCGLFSLLLVISMTRRLGGRSAAIWAGLALMSNEFFVGASSMEGTDSPAALFQLLALFLLIGNPQPGDISKTRAAGTGMLMGLGYLFRFTSLILVPFFGLFIASQSSERRTAYIFLLGFALTALPQLLSSALVTGNPFHNEQVHNVWFALHGNMNWRQFWDLMPDDMSLWDVMTADPKRFFNNWIAGFTSFFWRGTGWPSFVPLVAVPYVFKRTMRIGYRLLLVSTILAPVIVTSIAFCTDRLGLVSILGLSVGVGLLLGDILPFTRVRPASTVRSLVPVVFLILLVLMIGSWRAVLLSRSRPRQHAVDELVRGLGIQRVETVATNLTGMFHTEDKWMTPYSWVGDPRGARSIPELLDGREEKDDWQFVVLDYHRFYGRFLPLKREVERGGSELVPLISQDSLGVYLVRPKGIGAALADSISFSAGPILLAHTWIWDRDRIPIYLFWTTPDSLHNDYMIHVTLRGADGSVLCSHQCEPEMDTYPTTRWQPNTVIADFHLLEPSSNKESVAFLEVGVHCGDHEESAHRECCWIDRLHRGARTPFP